MAILTIELSNQNIDIPFIYLEGKHKQRVGSEKENNFF